MEIKIYIDVLFLTNFFMDCALLLLSAKIIKRKTHPLKVALSGFIGATYSLISFFSLIPFPENLMKIAIGCLMTFIVFAPRSLISFIKHSCIFFAVSFCFGGIAIALLYTTDYGSNMGAVLSGGTLYLNIPIYLLIFVSAVCYGILTIFTRSGRKYRRQADIIYDVRVTHKNKSVTFRALYDSGNTLTEPKSGLCVLIVYKKVLTSLIEANPSSNFIIPYKSISGYGEMKGFFPDKTEVNEKIIKVCIGISEETLGENFDAILPSALGLIGSNKETKLNSTSIKQNIPILRKDGMK